MTWPLDLTLTLTWPLSCQMLMHAIAGSMGLTLGLAEQPHRCFKTVIEWLPGCTWLLPVLIEKCKWFTALGEHWKPTKEAEIPNRITLSTKRSTSSQRLHNLRNRDHLDDLRHMSSWMIITFRSIIPKSWYYQSFQPTAPQRKSWSPCFVIRDRMKWLTINFHSSFVLLMILVKWCCSAIYRPDQF